MAELWISTNKPVYLNNYNKIARYNRMTSAHKLTLILTITFFQLRKFDHIRSEKTFDCFVGFLERFKFQTF